MIDEIIIILVTIFVCILIKKIRIAIYDTRAYEFDKIGIIEPKDKETRR